MILGASSGFGGATALELARNGYNIFGVHLDRKATLANVEKIAANIKALGRKAVFFNINASDEDKRADSIMAMAHELKQSNGTLRVVLHSLAFGSLKPFVGKIDETVTRPQMDMTLDVMAHSLVYWVQELVRAGLLRKGARVLSMTSAGSMRVWPTYGPVSAAKCALESHTRQLASELAPAGITVNSIMAGVTDTPALRKIPGNDVMLESARKRNPSGRLTTPEDIAGLVLLLADERSQWVTGNVIRADGGETIVD
ncbi:MAG: SDR family oxidoreductase [Candidatus Omnitrophica bacterium]|nr:SDR family oxidoreductase [Candidatus Omnitrophota bacterium]